MLPDALLRRDVLGGSLALAAAMTASVVPASAAPVGNAAGLLAHIDEAERRSRDARQAFDNALAAFEAALPPPHPDIDLTNRGKIYQRFEAERRLFDGKVVNRGTWRGRPTQRLVVTVASLNDDLADCDRGNRRRWKTLKRQRRRAARRELEVKALEADHRLQKLEEASEEADRHMHGLGMAIFARPATTAAAVQEQARMLCAFASIKPDTWREVQTGRWGVMLAASVRDLGATT